MVKTVHDNCESDGNLLCELMFLVCLRVTSNIYSGRVINFWFYSLEKYFKKDAALTKS